MAMPGMANVSTRLMISRLPMLVRKMLMPWRYMPMAAAAINPNTAPDAPPAMPLPGWMTSSPSEPASSAAKYSNPKRNRPRRGSSS